MNQFEFLKPWIEIEPERRPFLVAELKREVRRGHQLHDTLQLVEVDAIAQRIDNDDVLFILQQHSPEFAVVHLTSASTEASPLWPATQLFENLDDWIKNRMEPDHQDYI